MVRESNWIQPHNGAAAATASRSASAATPPKLTTKAMINVRTATAGVVVVAGSWGSEMAASLKVVVRLAMPQPGLRWVRPVGRLQETPAKAPQSARSPRPYSARFRDLARTLNQISKRLISNSSISNSNINKPKPGKRKRTKRISNESTGSMSTTAPMAPVCVVVHTRLID
ncbi:MAG: hypothetical protein O3C28_19185 [Proteobacteria bacterium]|nr:hypothetical protein [Pseudomonadota bacterium]